MHYTATYSPEDNKFRLYSDARLPRDVYDRVRAAGFIWAPKQALFVAPAWTPEREDLLLDLAGEIGDEDTSLVERAEERAERFGDYCDKRAADADRAHAAVAEIADAIPLGQPILIGHHSQRRAQKDAEKIENGMRKAVRLWQTSKYWTDRAAGAIRHAKYKELPAVRARRIKGLEADHRKQSKSKAEAERWLKRWNQDGLTLEQARTLANYGSFTVYRDEAHPYGWTAWDVLRPEEERYNGCPGWTVGQVREAAQRVYASIIDRATRWLTHLDNRLAYERAMLAESGGTAADKVKPERGGACRCWASPRGGWSVIQKVNAVSVTVLDNWGNGGRNFTRTIPFDKLTAVMSKADVDAKRAAGLLADSHSGIGFFVLDAPPPVTKPRAEPARTKFDELADALKAGVRVVSAPQLFPTPPDLAARVVALADIRPGHTVLEPSAGTGNLVRAIRDAAPGAVITAVEINRELALALAQVLGGRAEGFTATCADFLSLNGELGRFDRIVMNPPFERGADIEHIRHAYAKLAPGGRLVAICANGPRQREELGELCAAWIDLPPGSFKEQGTNVNAAIVVIDN
jgi:phospholipid N-methyltransferase